MKKILCSAAALLLAGIASAEIVVIQAEDAVVLGSNYVVVVDENIPSDAFNASFITSRYDRSSIWDVPYSPSDVAVYSVGDLTSNATYDVYARLHIGAGGYSDDSMLVATGFQTNTFTIQNGIAGWTGLDGAACTADGFHWVQMATALNAGDATNLVYGIAPREDGCEIDALAFVNAGLPVTDAMLNPSNSTVEVWAVGGIPEKSTATGTPLIEAYFLDGAGTVDASQIMMTLDGVNIADVTSSYTNFITTVSYTPAESLTLDSTHTALVVVATSPGSLLVTNSFSFYVGNPITYVDVTTNNTVMATTNDGPVEVGTAFITSTTNASTYWRARTDFGIITGTTNEPTSADCVPYAGGNSIYESLSTEDHQRLKTTAYVAETGNYRVYAYMWDNGSGWDLGAGLDDSTNALPAYTSSSTNAVALLEVGPDFWGTHTLYRVFLGTTEIADTNTPITVYLEDVPSSGDRTWIDGIGYQPVDATVPPQPTVSPDIMSVSVSEGSVTLVWASESIGTYTIMHKTNLNAAAWSPVKTGIAGGATTTMDSVPASGASLEFFMITGE
ncbi:MAG: hypothetical protein JXR25_08315 [Pontiellaceae bacterium]|nr:hypothetical protein [Pontiellaceae bacterium]MBN2784817.1 hypothetical protein [Pontiellaceae bacterium]